ncbi:MAG: CDP-6-deoxy-delta-3,4-glucoseen reductase [Proteobacteria bacterium]|nr:MAG: CDP-6-deoxy-delta-3,4-glucoseen reductase [Pseudomonadota bacterium]
MYTVTIQPGKHTFQVDEQENLLQAGLREGLALPYSCQGGSCGVCAATILKGQVDYPNGEPLGLSPDEREQGRALLCQAVAVSDLELESKHLGEVEDLPVKLLPARVEKMRQLNHDVMELTLKLPATEHLHFLAGQYIEVLLRDGKRRAFSLANAPFDDQFLELHIRHVPGGQFTDYVFNEMKVRALLRIEGPLGSFYIHEAERPLILVGGGTGFAPLKSMIEQLKADGFKREVYLYWGVRSQADLYMEALPRSWAAQYDNFHYVPVLSEPKAEDNWQGRTGWVHEAVVLDFSDLAGFDIYMSGPPAMILAGKKAFAEQGVPADQLYSDSFEYSSDTLKALAEAHEGSKA